MKVKMIWPVFLGCLLSLCTAHFAFALSELGKNPFYSNAIESEEEMVQMLLANSGDVQKGLTKAGMPELYEPLMAQLPEAEVERVQFNPGDTFPWMFYRKDGRGPVRIDKDVVWEGEEPFNSYQFSIDYNDRRHTFAVPPVCGNLAYVSAGAVPPPPAPVVEEEAAVEVPPAAPEEMEETVVEEAARFPLLVDVGYLYQPDPAEYLLLRVGMEFPMSDTFSIIGMIGGAPKISGSQGDDAFVADVFANYRMSRFFIGLGVGAWITGGGDDDLDHEDDDLDLIVNAGTRIFGEEDAFNTSFFIEARTGIDELEDFDRYGRFGAGLRFSF